jgi:twitching motility protein PilI
MSKRRNKNKKAGPVKLIRPDQPATSAVVESAVDQAPEELAMPEAHADHDLLVMQDGQDADVEQFSEETPFSAEESSVAEEVAATEAEPIAEEMEVATEAPVAAEMLIAEMDMSGPEADAVPLAPYVPEVEDASGALAQAIEVDPGVASKTAQVESIRIIEAHDQTIEMREQGAADGDADPIERSWTPVGASTNANAVRFDVPVSDEMREQGTAEGGEEPIVRPWVPIGGSANASVLGFDIPDSDAVDETPVDEPAGKGKKPDRRLKLNKLQKHARGAPEPETVEPEAAPEPAPVPKPRREPRMAAFAKLTEYQSLSLAHVPGLPEETDVPGHWRGVGFGLGGRRLVTAFDEVVEIMRMPQITHVPGTQPWMLGVANVRGTLLPVVDLKQFLEGERTVMHEGQRVLVVRQAGGNVAVLIDQLFGQRSFNDSQKTTTVADKESRYGYFIKQVYRVGDNDWGVFSMSMLTRTPEFRQAAA